MARASSTRRKRGHVALRKPRPDPPRRRPDWEAPPRARRRARTQGPAQGPAALWPGGFAASPPRVSRATSGRAGGRLSPGGDRCGACRDAAALACELLGKHAAGDDQPDADPPRSGDEDEREDPDRRTNDRRGAPEAGG